MIRVAFLCWCAALTCAAQQTYELRGRLDPPPRRWVPVSLSGAYSPFLAQELAGPDGKFRFKKLAPGAYVLVASMPGVGAVRQTIEIGPSTAKKGRVEIVIPFRPEPVPEAATRRLTVGVKELAIPREAKKEYDDAFEQLGRRDIEAARAHLKRATELAPQYAEAWNLLGTIAYQTQRYGEAERNFREALKYHPEAFVPLVNLGGVLINLSRCQEALEYNDRAVHERPTDALANSQLGMSYYCLQRDELAVKYLETAKRLDPGHFSNPQLVLADIYLKRGDPARAAAELEHYLKHRPDAPNAAQIREHMKKLRQK